ncbi:YT521-B-like domain-containing protein [Mycena vulgaris]|nr:YT521-B-like domain-containing protein [Mycena vulgaris]
MSGHGRGGSDQSRPGRRQSQSSQQRRPPPPGYPSLNPPPESPQGYHAPLYATANVQYPPPRAGYPGQYMMSPQPPLNMAHTPAPTFAYSPAFHVQEQSQSIHAGYPTISSYPQYPPDNAAYVSPQPQGAPSPQQPSPVYSASFRYPSPMSPSYAAYAPSSGPYSPSTSALYTHQQHVYPASSYPQFAHSPSAAPPDGEGGTWWYVPSQQQQQQQQRAQYESGPSAAYPFYPPPHTEQLPNGDYPASPAYPRTSTPSSSSAPSPAPPDPNGHNKPLVRRPYHPNPPAHRSEWVMWAGNVPSDAGHDELWHFFTQPADGGGSSNSSSSSNDGSAASASGTAGNHSGVLSIFLISRSSCAFVNYETEAHLEAAIKRFNGVPLRADPRCARLVCRVRRKDDDLRAGVGGQRGMGMHTRWVKMKADKGKAARDDSASSASDSGTSSSDATRSLAALSLGSSSEDDREHGDGIERPALRAHAAGSNSSGSFASTTSSLLLRHFPQRFFILKSLTRDDLDLSVRTGVWATQKHNEGILDRAFRTSKDVFLVFSVNKSGEFYGYARMSGPVGQGEGGRVAWAARSPDGTGSPTAARGATTSNPIPAHEASTFHAPAPYLLSIEHLVDNSPRPFPSPTSSPLRPPDVHSAPAVLGKPHRNISISSPVLKYSLDHHTTTAPKRAEPIKLDEAAPFRAMRPGAEVDDSVAAAAAHPHARTSSISSSLGLESVVEESGDKDEGGEPSLREESWGQDFKLQWICTERLPFQRTRHIRNPWNHDREIKVSRDGTELEPSVGQALLDEWKQFLASEGSQQTPISESGSLRSPARAGGGGGNTRS